MADSSLIRTGETPASVSGGDTRTLGPSDTTDTGSDMVGSGMTDQELANDTDSGGTGERPSTDRTDDGGQAADIDADRIEDDDPAADDPIE
jgi:hypothetical protein